MIEAIISLLAVCFGAGEGEDPASYAQTLDNQPEMFRAIDSVELKGFENLEVQEANEWFV